MAKSASATTERMQRVRSAEPTPVKGPDGIVIGRDGVILAKRGKSLI